MTGAGFSTVEITETISQAEAQCAIVGETATAGLTGIILISLGVITLLGAGALLVMSQLGRPFPFSELSPLAGGVLGLAGVVIWWLLLPDSDDGKLGWSAWVAITAGALALLSGSSPTVQRLYFPSDRPPGIGVRALAEGERDKEFVIRESLTGDQSLSLILADDLLRLANVER